MSRTIRKGWKALTGLNHVDGIAHKATNDWFSKKNACRGSKSTPKGDSSWEEYWGRDKTEVKKTSRRRQRRILNRVEVII